MWMERQRLVDLFLPGWECAPPRHRWSPSCRPAASSLPECRWSPRPRRSARAQGPAWEPVNTAAATAVSHLDPPRATVWKSLVFVLCSGRVVQSSHLTQTKNSLCIYLFFYCMNEAIHGFFKKILLTGMWWCCSFCILHLEKPRRP